ncbi:DRXIB protein, partial [Polyodon spathula]|nr:DRXIB protein [Polyodon spathula]
MAAHPWCLALLLALLLVGDFTLTDSAEPGSGNNKRVSSQQPTGTANYLQSPELWAQQPGHHRRQGGRKDKASTGLLSREVQQLGRPEDDGTGLEGLTPVRLELGERESRTLALQDEHHGGGFLGFGIPFHERDNHPPSAESTLKGRKQHKKHRGRDKARHDKGTQQRGCLQACQIYPLYVFNKLNQCVARSIRIFTLCTIRTQHSGAQLSAFDLCLYFQKPSQGRVRSDGDVMPTLDMALFDWTDYEDLKPAWPSSRKKGETAILTKYFNIFQNCVHASFCDLSLIIKCSRAGTLAGMRGRLPLHSTLSLSVFTGNLGKPLTLQ